MDQYNIEWDGIERRGGPRRDEDILKQMCEMMRQMQMNQQHMPREQVVYPQHEEKDITHSTLQMKDVWTIIGGLGSLLIGCFIVWNDLNRAITTNQHQFELFKSEISKSIENDDKTTDELKKKLGDIELKLKELDSTINQLYNKISKTNFLTTNG